MSTNKHGLKTDQNETAKTESIYPHFFAIILLILIGFIYFYPTLRKVVNQSDVSSFVGAAKETIDYRAANEGEEPLWTNSMFSGMPTTMISTTYYRKLPGNIYEFLFVWTSSCSRFNLGFISFYFSYAGIWVNPWIIHCMRALAFGLCSYNFQIIQVRHNAKMTAIAFMPAVLAALVYAFRKNRWLGAVLFGIMLSFEICLITRKSHFTWRSLRYSTVLLNYTAIKQKALPGFLKTAILLIVAAGLAGATSKSSVGRHGEYGKYTMRGGSD